MTTLQHTTADLSLEVAPFALLDLKPTGLDQRSRVVEIAIVHFSAHDARTVAFESLVRPEAGQLAGTEIHGIERACSQRLRGPSPRRRDQRL